ncbi:hypothetical protein [Rhodococcoides fascians]|uniref:hypothetical protein n=1 Tax=Rhodococcoides fascians TaxID=1828 RepID=UPI00055EE87F|nr:hypothetical protein [Rhodococcus fascians]
MHGVVGVDHDQFAVGQVDAYTLDVTAKGTLVEAGPGFIAIYTGVSYGPARVEVEVLAQEPDSTLIGSWEVVEQTTITSATPIMVMALDGTIVETIEQVPPGAYTVRVHGTGRDINTGLEVTEPSESYFFQFWSTPRTTTPTVKTLRKTDRAWSPEPAVHPTPIPEPDLSYVYVRDQNGEVVKVDPKSDAAEQVREWKNKYGGRPLSDALKTTIYAKYMAAYDRDLLDRIEAGGEQLQLQFARWCARAAFEQAGLAGIDWLDEMLDGLDTDEVPVDVQQTAKARVDADPDIPKTLVTGLPGEREQVQQHQALLALGTTIFHTESGEPLKAALWSYRAAAQTYGMDYERLTAAANNAFPSSG